MNKKFIIAVFFGIILTLLGLLWFLQGPDIVHLKPILCFSNCEPITGESSLWQIIGAITFLAGALITGLSVRKSNVLKK